MDTDLTFTRSGELIVTQIEGNTEAGIEFVDRYFEEKMYVHDAGVIFIPDTAAIERLALAEGLTIEFDLIATEKPGGVR